MSLAKVEKKYRHYKGGEYIVIALGKHTETGEALVVYQASDVSSDLATQSVWVRPQAMFESSIEIAGKVTERFSLID